MHHVPLQGHQAEGVVPRPHDGNARVQVRGDHRAAQQVFHNAPVGGVALHQVAGHAQAAGQAQGLPLPVIEQLGAHGGHGQEGGPAQAVLPQVFNQGFGGVLVLGDDVLLGGAQGHVNGGLIALGHGEQLSQHAPHPLHAPLMGKGHGPLHRLVEALHFPLHLFHELQPAHGGLQLAGLFLGALAQGVQLPIAGGQLLLAGAVGLHQLVPAGLGLLQLPLGRLGGGLQLLQALGHLLILGEEFL